MLISVYDFLVFCGGGGAARAWGKGVLGGGGGGGGGESMDIFWSPDFPMQTFYLVNKS